jgi:hypothetical protein
MSLSHPVFLPFTNYIFRLKKKKTQWALFNSFALTWKHISPGVHYATSADMLFPPLNWLHTATRMGICLVPIVKGVLYVQVNWWYVFSFHSLSLVVLILTLETL